MCYHRKFGNFWPCLIACAGSLLLGPLAVRGQESPVAKITALERELSRQSTFNWRLHNELRHWYGAVDLRKSFYHSNVIFKHSLMDSYLLNIMAGWAIERDRDLAIINLYESAGKYPEFSFVAAACWIKAGDLEMASSPRAPDRAATAYRKVLGLKGTDLAAYRQLAERRLRGLDVAVASATPDAKNAVQKVAPKDVKARSEEKGKAVLGLLPRDKSAGNVVTAVPGQTDRVWDGNTLGGFKDLLAGKKILDDAVVDRMGAFVREQYPEKNEALKETAKSLRAKLLDLGEDPLTVEPKVVDAVRAKIKDYFEQASPAEKQQLVDRYVEQGAPITQVFTPAEIDQIQWYQVPTGGDVKQIVRNYAPPAPVAPPTGSGAPPATGSAPSPTGRDTDLATKIMSPQLTLTMTEAVYDHRPGQDGKVAEIKRIVTGDSAKGTSSGTTTSTNPKTSAPSGGPSSSPTATPKTGQSPITANALGSTLQKQATATTQPSTKPAPVQVPSSPTPAPKLVGNQPPPLTGKMPSPAPTTKLPPSPAPTTKLPPSSAPTTKLPPTSSPGPKTSPAPSTLAPLPKPKPYQPISAKPSIPAPRPVVLAGSSYTGSETLGGYGRLTFAFGGGGTATMYDTDGATNGSWSQSGNSVTLRFYNGTVVYQGRLNGRSLSGTASNGRANWSWSLTRQ
jgi:hypothetical protein